MEYVYGIISASLSGLLLWLVWPPAIDDLVDTDLPKGEEEEEPDGMWIAIDNGEVLEAVLFMDADGNPVDSPYDARSVVAGSAAQGWYEIDVADGSWVRPSLH